jgi:predicted HAD superfamily Cof-like phosphohydrolase
MEKQLSQVEDFHNAFLVENNKEPSLISEDQFILRHGLMAEENEEYLEACWEEDIIKIADALGDQLYILLGTMLKHGLQFKIAKVFDEIHQSNMSKLDHDGKPIFREDGKILKGPRYFKPNISKILFHEDNNGQT